MVGTVHNREVTDFSPSRTREQTALYADAARLKQGREGDQLVSLNAEDTLQGRCRAKLTLEGLAYAWLKRKPAEN
jgi:hypothetical protein